MKRGEKPVSTWHGSSGNDSGICERVISHQHQLPAEPKSCWLPVRSKCVFPLDGLPPPTPTTSFPVGTCSCHFAFSPTPFAYLTLLATTHRLISPSSNYRECLRSPTATASAFARTDQIRSCHQIRSPEIQLASEPSEFRRARRGGEDEAEDAEQDHPVGAGAHGGGGAGGRHHRAGAHGGDLEGQGQGVAREGVRQGVGVLQQQVLLQRHHHRLLQGVPVREPLRQAQHPRRQGRRVLGLPVLHPRRGALRAARVLHHRRKGDADEGALRLPRTRRRSHIMWVRRRYRRPAGVGTLLQPRDEPSKGLLRQVQHSVSLRRGRRVLRPRRAHRLLELQLRRHRRRDPAGPAAPPGVPGAERDAGVGGGHVAVDEPHQEEAALGARRLRGQLEAHQERHAQQALPGIRSHHQRALRRHQVWQRLHRRHECHHLALPVLP